MIPDRAWTRSVWGISDRVWGISDRVSGNFRSGLDRQSQTGFSALDTGEEQSGHGKPLRRLDRPSGSPLNKLSRVQSRDFVQSWCPLFLVLTSVSCVRRPSSRRLLGCSQFSTGYRLYPGHGIGHTSASLHSSRRGAISEALLLC